MKARTVAAVFLLILAVACSSSAGSAATGPTGSATPTHSRRPSRSITTPTPTPTPTPSPHQHHERPPQGTIRQVAALRKGLLALASSTETVYALVKGPASTASIPMRIVPPASVTRGGPISVGGSRPTMLAIVDGQPWVASRSGSIARLDPASMAVMTSLSIANPIEQLAASPGRLWVVTPSAVEALDPFSGSMLLTFAQPARITRFAVSPDGTRLYVVLAHPVRHDQLPVFELDSSSGDVLASTRGGYADLAGVSGLVATDAGVWIVSPTGNMGSGIFARASDLRQRKGEPGTGVIEGSNSIRVWLAGSMLWVALGDGSLACVDGHSGKDLGLFPADDGLGQGGVVAAAGRWYSGTGSAIDLMRPPDACSH